MKKMPPDYPYNFVPAGMSWSKKNGWTVRRKDQLCQTEKTFREFEPALEFCNHIFADKRPAITIAKLSSPLEEPQKDAPYTYRSAIGSLAMRLESLVERVETIEHDVAQIRDYAQTILAGMKGDFR